MVEVGFKSDKGLKRNNNEDAFFVVPENNVFMVADGVGGSNSGEIASRTTISKIAEFVRCNRLGEDFCENEINDYFRRCLESVNKSVYDMSRRSPENTGMATTVTIVYIAGNNAHVVNVGDSRAYIYSKGSLIQITEDHTYVNTLIKEGAITKEEAQFHAKKNVITRAVGGEAVISPDFFFVEAKPDDIIVLCTDGLHGEIGDDNISRLLSAGDSMAETCSNMVNKANQCGGRDNITVICLKLLGGQA